MTVVKPKQETKQSYPKKIEIKLTKAEINNIELRKGRVTSYMLKEAEEGMVSDEVILALVEVCAVIHFLVADMPGHRVDSL